MLRQSLEQDDFLRRELSLQENNQDANATTRFGALWHSKHGAQYLQQASPNAAISMTTAHLSNYSPLTTYLNSPKSLLFPPRNKPAMISICLSHCLRAAATTVPMLSIKSLLSAPKSMLKMP